MLGVLGGNPCGSPDWLFNPRTLFSTFMNGASVKIAPEDAAEWGRLQRIDARAASAHYFARILPAVVAYHHDRDGARHPYQFLLSLMGMSPETTVLAVNFLRPTNLVVAVSRNAEAYFEQCAVFLAGHDLLPRAAVRMVLIDPTDHIEMHRLLSAELGAARGGRIVDITGGKKIMSAVAGAAAWSLGLPICYIESRAYSEEMRRPAPGSEELLVLQPPAAAAGSGPPAG